MKKIYLIPGIEESHLAKNYREVKKIAKSLGFSVIPIKIDWDKTKGVDYFIKQADRAIPQSDPDAYILGFSLGAYLAGFLSNKKKVAGFIFCSLAPCFKEDLADFREKHRRYLGEKMMRSLTRYSFPKNIKTKAWFLAGDKEWPQLINRTKASYKNWRGEKELQIMKGVGHDMSHKTYNLRLKKILMKISKGA